MSRTTLADPSNGIVIAPVTEVAYDTVYRTHCGGWPHSGVENLQKDCRATVSAIRLFLTAASAAQHLVEQVLVPLVP